MEPSLLKNPAFVVSVVLAIGYMVWSIASLISVRASAFIKKKHREVNLFMVSGILLSTVSVGYQLARVQEDANVNRAMLERLDQKTDVVEQMQNARQSFDTLLNNVCSTQIQENIDFFENGIHQNKVTFTGIERFSDAYLKCLRLFPDAHVLATSLPKKKYYWNPDTSLTLVEKEIKTFMQRDGAMTRIFFVRPEDLTDPESVAIMNKQIRLGVDVRTLEMDRAEEVCEGLKFFVLMENPRRELMWHIGLKSNSVEMKDFTYSTNHDDYARYKVLFEKLKERSVPWTIK